MSDVGAVFVALCVVLGCLVPHGFPLVLVLVCLGIAIVSRKALLVALTTGLLASSLSSMAWAGLDRTLPDGIDGAVTLVGDSQPVQFGGVRVEARVDGRRFQLWARGKTADALKPMLAGQHARVVGPVRPLTGKTVAYLRRRHIAGNVNVRALEYRDSGGIVTRSVNWVRGLMQRGSGSLPQAQQSLLGGFVLGDDRDEPAQLKQEFRDSGLSHLLAVSGQNVAFVLLIAAPLLKRLSLAGRFFGGVGVLLFFGALTRWEPSVIRAEAMAAVVLGAAYLGRPVSIWRTLSLAGIASMLLDPFLVGSVGFLLSMGACVGMACLGGPFERWLRGPMWLRRTIAYSAAAQIGVAPVLAAIFPSMPIVAILANLLAEPVAAGIMVWGVVGGLSAGLVGEPVATLLQVPNHLMLSWIQWVAQWTVRLGLGSWSPMSLGVLLGALAVVCWWRIRPGRSSGQRGSPGTVFGRERSATRIPGQG